jgi:DNA helicase-2/ATP-dependent DNA helicase PcrA
MIPKLAIEGEAHCFEFEDEDEEASWIINRILDLGENGSRLANIAAIPLEGCAVLARNRYVFSALRNALDRKNVCYNERVASGGAATSESDLFNYFHAGLRLMVNPNDRLHLRRLNIEFSPESPYTSFEEIYSASGTYDGLTREASDGLRKAWGFLLDSPAFRFDLALDVLKRVCDNCSAFSGDNDRSLAANDCNQWIQWWERYCLSTDLFARSLSGFLRALSLGEVLDSQTKDGITLSTVHLAKGLEFDVVFVIGVNDGTFPDYRSQTDTQRDEERHSMFVAITRSRRLCYVTRPKVRKMPWGGLRLQSPSPFFKELKAVDV